MADDWDDHISAYVVGIATSGGCATPLVEYNPELDPPDDDSYKRSRIGFLNGA